jgi:hypothetical protein
MACYHKLAERIKTVLAGAPFEEKELFGGVSVAL